MKSRIPFVIIFLLSVCMVASSCKHKPIYEKYLKMKNSTWDRFTIQQYDIPIEDVGKSYDFTLSVRNTSQFQYDDLPVYVILTTTSGEERMREVHLTLHENGKLVGTPNGKIFQVQTPLWKNINISEKGKCKITLENIIPKIQTDGIDEIGIIVTRSQSK